MKKAILLISAVLLFAASASAQYGNVTFNTDKPLEIVQIDQMEDVTLLYCSCTAPSDNFKMFADDNTRLRFKGDRTSHKLKNAGNIPVGKGETFIMMRKAGDRVNFVLLFDKVDLSRSFDIEAPEGSFLSFSDVCADLEAVSDPVDVDSFLDAGSLLIGGSYSRDGLEYRFFEEGGLLISAAFAYDKRDHKLFKAFVEMSNDTGHDVKFSTKKVSMECEKGGKSTELKVLSLREYDKLAAGDLGEAMDANRFIRDYPSHHFQSYSNRARSRGESGLALGMSMLSLMSSLAVENDIRRYNEALDEAQGASANGYFGSMTIEDGESFRGFVAAKYTCDDGRILTTVTINGKDYSWEVE